LIPVATTISPWVACPTPLHTVGRLSTPDCLNLLPT